LKIKKDLKVAVSKHLQVSIILKNVNTYSFQTCTTVKKIIKQYFLLQTTHRLDMHESKYELHELLFTERFSVSLKLSMSVEENNSTQRVNIDLIERLCPILCNKKL
jgi:hypothetical protein